MLRDMLMIVVKSVITAALLYLGFCLTTAGFFGINLCLSVNGAPTLWRFVIMLVVGLILSVAVIIGATRDSYE